MIKKVEFKMGLTTHIDEFYNDAYAYASRMSDLKNAMVDFTITYCDTPELGKCMCLTYERD